MTDFTEKDKELIEEKDRLYKIYEKAEQICQKAQEDFKNNGIDGDEFNSICDAAHEAWKELDDFVKAHSDILGVEERH